MTAAHDSEGPETVWLDLHFWPHVDRSRDCWIWTATKMGRGYGSVRPAEGKNPTGAHRVAWALHNGRWPTTGEVVMHSCDNPACVNPAHLSVGSQSENIRQAVERGRHKPYRAEKKNTCPSGHELTDENTQLVPSRGTTVRRCKTCSRERNAEWRSRNRERLAQDAREYRARKG